MSSRRAAALPSSERKYGRGQVCSMPTAALLVRACTVTLSTTDEDRAVASLSKLQPRGTPSPREGNPTGRTQLSCTALSDRSLPNPRPAANPAVL